MDSLRGSWRVGSGAGLGLVAVGGSSDYEVVGFYPFVVAAADGDEVVDVGGSLVAVPLGHVVEFASVHGLAALEAATVPDSYGEALGGVAESLVAPQP